LFFFAIKPREEQKLLITPYTKSTLEALMMKHRTLLATALLVAAASLQPLMADHDSGRTIGLTCFGCHGADGVSLGAVPSMKGMSEEHVRTAMTDFKSGKRSGTIMNRIAKGYTDDQIKALAKFVAGL